MQKKKKPNRIQTWCYSLKLKEGNSLSSVCSRWINMQYTISLNNINGIKRNTIVYVRDKGNLNRLVYIALVLTLVYIYSPVNTLSIQLLIPMENMPSVSHLYSFSQHTYWWSENSFNLKAGNGNLHASSALNRPLENIYFCSSSLGK